MARGWESKSIEAQQAEAGEASGPKRAHLRPEEAARFRERQGLQLSRQRVLQQLASDPEPRYRKLLEEALADLDAKLGQSGVGPSGS
jgi:hypothetical protein